jgi:hypothetical protein
MSTQDYMKVYAETKQRITGVVYFLLHGRNKKINSVKLAQLLEGKLKRIPYEIEEEDIIIPKVFQHKGEVVLQSRIEKVVLTGTSLFGKATVDTPIRIRYREKKILIVGTSEVYFLIFRDESSKKYFLVLLASRTKSAELHAILSENLKQFGLVTSPSKIEHEDIQEITKRLKGKLKFTIVGNFPTPEISKKAIWGYDYINQQSYKDDILLGSIYQNQFQFKDRQNESKVITVSDDGLIRFYNNISCKDLEWFIKTEIVPFLKQTKKPQIPSLVGFTFEDLFIDDV